MTYEPPPSSNKPQTPATMETDAHVATPKAPTGSRSNKVVPDPKLRKVFYVDELERALRPVFEWVYYQDPESVPFRQPVDPKALGIPVSHFTNILHICTPVVRRHSTFVLCST